MKEIICAEMGGPETCTALISGGTAEETVMNGMKHVDADHPEMAEKIKAMPRHETEQWMADFREKWDALPEMV